MSDLSIGASRGRGLSEGAFERAKRSIAGGDSSSMRVPLNDAALVIDRGLGCRVWSVDGEEYIDLNMGYGPLLFGHRPSFLIGSVVRQIEDKGSLLGFPQELSPIVAEKIKQLYPGIELLRFANSGTEAIASAVRLARTHTQKTKIILFEGHYHGWSDTVFHKCHVAPELLSKSGLTRAIAGTNGLVSAPLEAWVVPWNDADLLETALRKFPDDVAAVIMEPVMGNAGVIPPEPGYLQSVRELTRRYGALLIFDEVITGLRIAGGGAQQVYGVVPDITVLSKALGGGFPVAAFGASAEIMNCIVEGRLFHGGVYSGNATALAAANAVLTKIIAEKDLIYSQLETRSVQFAVGMAEILHRGGIPHLIQRAGAMVGIYLLRAEHSRLRSYRDVCALSRIQGRVEMHRALLDVGVYIHSNHFEPSYISTAHSKEDILETLDRTEHAVKQLASQHVG